MVDQSKPFQRLRISRLTPHTGYARPHFYIQNPVKASSSALEVMTDLRFIPAATVSSDLDLDTATQKMIARGVRSLLVTNALEDVIGIITSRDLLGERPQAAMHARGIPFGEVRVSDVMTSDEHIEVLHLDDVLHAHVGDVVETLKHSGRQHALVVEEDSSTGKTTIRGIFSASQIARQLGVHAQPHALSDTFEGIERAMAAQY
ncbi:CBS domain-containing protein [Noviherbaspirillum sp. ST9]|uniref:CBS domain-containing protein n=1 Tax=Noviherbaspirillum sp. ST9 TaxID=3401606 RepID=UPI003B58B103